MMQQRQKKPVIDLTRQVPGQVWVVHEAVAGKLHTLQPDWNMDVIEPERWERSRKQNLNICDVTKQMCLWSGCI